MPAMLLTTVVSTVGFCCAGGGGGSPWPGAQRMREETVLAGTDTQVGCLAL